MGIFGFLKYRKCANLRKLAKSLGGKLTCRASQRPNFTWLGFVGFANSFVGFLANF